MNIITILTLLAFAIYGVYIGLIPSISDSYRTVKQKAFYHIFFAVTAFLIIWQSHYPYKEVVKVWMFPLAGFFFWMISIAPMFWKAGAGKGWHVIFTYTAIGLGMACVIVQFWGTWTWVISLGTLVAGGLAIRKWATNPTLWAEYLAACTIFLPFIQKP